MMLKAAIGTTTAYNTNASRTSLTDGKWSARMMLSPHSKVRTQMTARFVTVWQDREA
jgi:hypothetical protein